MGFSRCAEMYHRSFHEKRGAILLHMYENALLSFRGFCGHLPKLSFRLSNPRHLRCYGRYLYERGKLNTVSTYMRMLRSVFIIVGVELGRAPLMFTDCFTGVYRSGCPSKEGLLPATEFTHKLLYGDPKSDILRRTQAIAALMFQFLWYVFP